MLKVHLLTVKIEILDYKLISTGIPNSKAQYFGYFYVYVNALWIQWRKLLLWNVLWCVWMCCSCIIGCLFVFFSLHGHVCHTCYFSCLSCVLSWHQSDYKTVSVQCLMGWLCVWNLRAQRINFTCPDNRPSSLVRWGLDSSEPQFVYI